MIHPGRGMRGITLVEMAMVLLILGVLTRAAIAPLTASRTHRNHRLAEVSLQSIREGLWAHVIANGVLPCPVPLDRELVATTLPAATSSLPIGQGVQSLCQSAHGGVPARELGLAGSTGINGALLDPWNRPYRFSVSLNSHTERGALQLPDWTTPGEASSVGIAELTADLVLCNRAVQARCPGSDMRANQLTFIVLTTGEDITMRGEQSENQDADTVFVLQESSIRADHPFDDQLVWGSSAETLYWMLRAGWLP